MSRNLSRRQRDDDFMSAIDPGKRNHALLAEVKKRSGTDLNRCFQCRSCANGCPYLQGMDYPPNVILRLLQYGMYETALESKTIWVCAACHTCSSQCPMAIDIPGVMGVLRLMALEQGTPIARPDILEFHEAVLHSLKQYGRAHKLGIMSRYKLRTHRWFNDLDVGLKMLAKRKLELMPSRVKAMEEIIDLFNCYGRKSR